MIQNLKRFDVVLVDFGDNLVAGEQGGKRPGIVVQNDIGNIFSCTTIIIPLTTKLKKVKQPTHALIKKSKLNGLEADSLALAECLRQISKKRIIKYYGKIDDYDKQKIKNIYDANFGDFEEGIA